jgi:hypothetical protein
MKKHIFVVKTWLFMLCLALIVYVPSCKKDISSGTKKPAVNSAITSGF